MNTRSFLSHIGFFVLIEVLFVFIIFREFPSGDIVTLTGMLHIVYWGIVAMAGWIRQGMTKVWTKFCCTYIPIVYHVWLHIYMAHEIITHHDEQSTTWIVIGAVAAGILIALGEYWLHRTNHCLSHHQTAHAHCHDADCQSDH